MIPKRKNADDEWMSIHPTSLEEPFLDVLQKLDFPPLDDDRLNIKIRFFAKSATEVIEYIMYIRYKI